MSADSFVNACIDFIRGKPKNDQELFKLPNQEDDSINISFDRVSSYRFTSTSSECIAQQRQLKELEKTVDSSFEPGAFSTIRNTPSGAPKQPQRHCKTSNNVEISNAARKEPFETAPVQEHTPVVQENGYDEDYNLESPNLTMTRNTRSSSGTDTNERLGNTPIQEPLPLKTENEEEEVISINTPQKSPQQLHISVRSSEYLLSPKFLNASNDENSKKSLRISVTTRVAEYSVDDQIDSLRRTEPTALTNDRNVNEKSGRSVTPLIENFRNVFGDNHQKRISHKQNQGITTQTPENHDENICQQTDNSLSPSIRDKRKDISSRSLSTSPRNNDIYRDISKRENRNSAILANTSRNATKLSMRNSRMNIPRRATESSLIHSSDSSSIGREGESSSRSSNLQLRKRSSSDFIQNNNFYFSQLSRMSTNEILDSRTRNSNGEVFSANTKKTHLAAEINRALRKRSLSMGIEKLSDLLSPPEGYKDKNSNRKIRLSKSVKNNVAPSPISPRQSSLIDDTESDMITFSQKSISNMNGKEITSRKGRKNKRTEKPEILRKYLEISTKQPSKKSCDKAKRKLYSVGDSDLQPNFHIVMDMHGVSLSNSSNMKHANISSATLSSQTSSAAKSAASSKDKKRQSDSEVFKKPFVPKRKNVRKKRKSNEDSLDSPTKKVKTACGSEIMNSSNFNSKEITVEQTNSLGVKDILEVLPEQLSKNVETNILISPTSDAQENEMAIPSTLNSHSLSEQKKNQKNGDVSKNPSIPKRKSVRTKLKSSKNPSDVQTRKGETNENSTEKRKEKSSNRLKNPIMTKGKNNNTTTLRKSERGHMPLKPHWSFEEENYVPLYDTRRIEIEKSAKEIKKENTQRDKSNISKKKTKNKKTKGENLSKRSEIVSQSSNRVTDNQPDHTGGQTHDGCCTTNQITETVNSQCAEKLDCLQNTKQVRKTPIRSSINERLDTSLEWVEHLLNTGTSNDEGDSLPNSSSSENFQCARSKDLIIKTFENVSYLIFKQKEMNIFYMRFPAKAQKSRSKTVKYRLTFFLLTGKLEFNVCDEMTTLSGGDLIAIDKEKSYIIRNPDDIQKALVLVTKN